MKKFIALILCITMLLPLLPVTGLAAKLVGVTTLFCLISMPLMLILAEKIL